MYGNILCKNTCTSRLLNGSRNGSHSHCWMFHDSEQASSQQQSVSRLLHYLQQDRLPRSCSASGSLLIGSNLNRKGKYALRRNLYGPSYSTSSPRQAHPLLEHWCQLYCSNLWLHHRPIANSTIKDCQTAQCRPSCALNSGGGACLSSSSLRRMLLPVWVCESLGCPCCPFFRLRR